jgi:hypothetical protein
MIAACKMAERKLMIAYRIQYEPYNRIVPSYMRSANFGRIYGETGWILLYYWSWGLLPREQRDRAARPSAAPTNKGLIALFLRTTNATIALSPLEVD